MSANAEQRLQQQVDELMIRLAASEEARKKAEDGNYDVYMKLEASLRRERVYKQRAEAAEQRIRESQEQEPIAYYSDGCSYIAWVPTYNCELPLYAQPIIPPSLEELQREIEELKMKLKELTNGK